MIRRASRLVFMFIVSQLTLAFPVSAGPYNLSLHRELVCFGAGGLLNLGGVLAGSGTEAPSLADLANLDKDEIPAFERSYAGRWNPSAENASEVVLAGCLLLPISLIPSRHEDAKEIGLMYSETLALAYGGSSLAKGVSQRYRPFAYDDKAALHERLDEDAKRSFFSAHASLIASGLVFTAKVYSDYHPDFRYRSLMWSAVLVGAISGSWLRVDSGRHFPSDVAVGVVWGSVAGYAIPVFHHKKSTSLSVLPFVRDGQKGAVIVKRF